MPSCVSGVSLHASAWPGRVGTRRTWMSWMDMTEQGKFMSELTLTTTVSTPSGKTYLKYWEKRQRTEVESSRREIESHVSRRSLLAGSQIDDGRQERRSWWNCMFCIIVWNPSRSLQWSAFSLMMTSVLLVPRRCVYDERKVYRWQFFMVKTNCMSFGSLDCLTSNCISDVSSTRLLQMKYEITRPVTWVKW